MRWLLSFPILCMACGTGSLPELPPETTEDSPYQVQILGVWSADGTDALIPTALGVGRAYSLRVRVSALGDRPLANEPLVASIESASFERVLSFPRGNTCLTPAEPDSIDDEGVCSIVFFAEGLVRDVALQVRAQRALTVTDTLVLGLQPDVAQPRLRFIVPGVGTASWIPGDADPLAALQPLRLSLEEPQAVPLVVELKDPYGNPLSGQRVDLTAWLEAQDDTPNPPDAGPENEAGTSLDAGTKSDISSPGEVGSNDANPLLDGSGSTPDATEDTNAPPTNDAGPSDTVQRGDASSDRDASRSTDLGLTDDAGTGGDAGPASDTGPIEQPGAIAEGRVIIHRLVAGECSTEVEDETEHKAISDVLGRATFCLKAGEELGAWQVVLRLDDLVPAEQIAARTQDGFVLSGRTRAGDPDRLVLLGHDNEAEPLSRCEPGDVTPLEYFQVLSQGGRPVAGAEVNIATEGAIRLLSFANPVSDEQGRVAVQVSCPVTMPNRSTVNAALAGATASDVGKRALLYVRLETQRIERLRLMTDQPGQALLDLGRGRAFEPFYFRVLAEGSRGTPAVESRLNLSLFTSQDNNDLLFLSGDRCQQRADRRVQGQSVYTDADGFYRFALCAVGLSTVLRPMTLVVRAHGQTTQLQVPITLLPGEPTRVLADPPGRVTTLVGGSAGVLDVVVQDQAGNGVPAVQVEILRPPAVELSGCTGDCNRLVGTTNAVGRFSSWISRVTREGEHEVTLRAAQAGWSQTTAKTVAAGLGAATQIGFYRNQRLIVPVLGAAQIDLPVGGAIERPITLRLANRAGGGVPGEGIAVALVAGEPNQCGRVGIDGRVTDDGGEIVFGGDNGVALEAGPVVTDCTWRFSAGIDVQALLRIRQVAGAPYGGSPEVDQGTALIALRRPPSDWGQGAPLTAEVRVRATDRFGNPKSGLRMWLNATNCWIETPLQQLGPNEERGWVAGEGVWRVAGGRDHNAPCTLHLRYPGGEWVDARPLVIPIQGLPVPEITSVDRVERITGDRRHGCSANAYWRGNACYLRGGYIQLDHNPETLHHLAIEIADEWVVRPDHLSNQLNATCYEPELDDPFTNCSRIQLLDVLEADGQHVYQPIAELPIRWRVIHPEWNTNRHLEFHIQLPQQFLSDGRDKALRMVQPDGHTVGPPIAIYASPPIRWRQNATRVLSPDDPQEQALLWGGHRLQLDDDEAQEAIFCGHDSRGGLLALIDRDNRDDPYPETIQGIRLWGPVDANSKWPTANRANLACAFGDFDEDGRNDLVVPMPTSPAHRIPRLMLLRGIPQAPFFDVDQAVTVTLNNAPPYPAQPPRQIAVTDQPNRIWICFGGLRESTTWFRGVCDNDRALSVYIQSNPFTDNPNQAIGAQVAHPLHPILKPFQVRHQVHLEKLGTVTSYANLIGNTKPWPEMPLSGGEQINNARFFNELDRSLTTINNTGDVTRWDDQGRVVAEFSTPENANNGVFSPDGSRVASVAEGVVWVWRVADGSLLYTLPGHTLGPGNTNQTSTIVRWTAVTDDHPESFLVLGLREYNRATCNDRYVSGRMHFRVYSYAGELVSERRDVSPWVSAPNCPAHFLAATPGANIVYTGRYSYNRLSLWSGQTGEPLGEVEQPGGIYQLSTNREASRAYMTMYGHNRSPLHARILALPGAEVLWEACVGGHNPGCADGHENWHHFSPNGRFLARYNSAYMYTTQRQRRGRLYLPTGGPYHMGFSSHSNYAFLREYHSHEAQSYRDIHVLPVVDKAGIVGAVTHATGSQITNRSRRPERTDFHFSTHLVGQEHDDGKVMILPRRLYMDGGINPGGWGGQYGHPDCYNNCDRRGYWFGDGEIVVAEGETWRPKCGNARLDPGELIDTGQPWNQSWDCGAARAALCGNNRVDDGEECDDGNANDDDGCAGCLQMHPGRRQNEPIASCAALDDQASNGSYWVGEPGNAQLIYCLRSNGAWWTLAARFTNDDGLQWRGSNWTGEYLTRGNCAELQDSEAEDCRSQAWDHMSTQELLAVERLERNDQVYEGTRLYRLDQARTMSELANLPADTNVLTSTQLIAGGDNILALAPADNPPQMLVNYDLGNDGCRLATSSNSGECTSGLACRQNNRDYWCHGDVNTDYRDTRDYRHHGEQPAWRNHIVHLFVRAAGN